jgi:hypothetical protein
MVSWFDDEKEPSPFLKALEEARRLAAREGWHYQPSKRSLSPSTNMRRRQPGNRDFFLNKLHNVVSNSRKGDIP